MKNLIRRIKQKLLMYIAPWLVKQYQRVGVNVLGGPGAFCNIHRHPQTDEPGDAEVSRIAGNGIQARVRISTTPEVPWIALPRPILDTPRPVT